MIEPIAVSGCGVGVGVGVGGGARFDDDEGRGGGRRNQGGGVDFAWATRLRASMFQQHAPTLSWQARKQKADSGGIFFTSQSALNSGGDPE
jgi:hypothetical protein